MLQVKITNSYFNSSIVAIESRVEKVEITKDIEQGGRCEVTFEPGVTLALREYHGVEILDVTSEAETSLFKGFAHSFTYSLTSGNQVEIKALFKDGKELLKTKANIGASSFTGQPASICLQAAVTSWNTRSGETWTIDCPSTAISVSFTDGQGLDECAQSVADALGFGWIVSEKTIRIAQVLGTDRSSPTSSDYNVASYNASDLRGSNIASIERETYGTLANDITVTGNGTSNVADTDSITMYGRSYLLIEDSTQPAAQLAPQQLARLKVPQFTYSCQLTDNTLAATAGDKIRLLVENTGVFDIDTSVNVIGEKLVIENGVTVKTLELSNTLVKRDDIVSILRSISEQ